MPGPSSVTSTTACPFSANPDTVIRPRAASMAFCTEILESGGEAQPVHRHRHPGIDPPEAQARQGRAARLHHVEQHAAQVRRPGGSLHAGLAPLLQPAQQCAHPLDRIADGFQRVALEFRVVAVALGMLKDQR